MGWNSWNRFGCDVSEKLMRETADTLVSTGMKDAGYQYLVIDDCWQVRRDDQGKIVADPERFPGGMKALADYVHGKGLKFGLYSDAGTQTCGAARQQGPRGPGRADLRRMGSRLPEVRLVQPEGQETRAAYGHMSRALRATGRPIVFSLCEWGSTKPWLWAQGVGQLWRATGDIQDCWDCGKSWGGMGVVHIVDIMADLYPYAGPGHWNDPDMLEVGNGGLKPAESRAHFSFWALFAAPLMAGNDLRSDVEGDARHPDEPRGHRRRPGRPGHAGPQGPRQRPPGGLDEAPGRRLAGRHPLQPRDRSRETRGSWDDIGFFPRGQGAVRDLWKKADVGAFTGASRPKSIPTTSS